VRVDRAASDRIVEQALASADILNESQKANVRLMAEDLLEGRRVWKSVPFRLIFEFNRRCNVQCVHCGIEREGSGEQPLVNIARLLDQIGWGVMDVMPFAGGEPTLAPLHELAALLRPRNIWLNLVTNGLLFSGDYFRPIADVTARVQYSFHAHRPDAFHRIMPQADYAKVVRNLADGVRIAEESDTQVVTCIVLMHDALDHLESYVRFVADLGVRRVIVQKLYPTTTPNLDELDPHRGRSDAEIDEVYARTLATAKRLGVFVETNVPQLFGDPENVARVRSRFELLQENAQIVALYRPDFCISTAMQTLVEWNGNVLPCCRDHIVLGNLESDPFESCWNGPRMQELRRTHFERTPSPMCARCRKYWVGHP
jgi:radical SAM protein with 4Fe4S-binding SPASM domain